jgi:hypothetical protein
MPIRPVDHERPLNVLLFPMDGDSVGRVTFEGLDAIRAARGERLRYERQDVPYARGEWVYNIVLDGKSTEHASVWLRTRRSIPRSSFVSGFLGRNRVETDGVAGAETFKKQWITCLEAVASRRREMGIQ